MAIALVVMIIYLFLRNIPATIIPGVAVPLSLIGTFAVMVFLDFSINNLTLMALTIATGFVVDDAIVVIENISRYIEKGEKPLAAALKGAGEIGFTIISLTFSLIAVLIPLLFMGDIVGRLFREFAITLAVAILISAVVSLTLTPMMCARMLSQESLRKQNRFSRASEKMFDRIIAAYGRGLAKVLNHPWLTLSVALSTLLLSVLLWVFIPKGFFPVQDNGIIQGTLQAPQSSSFANMAQRQRQVADVILQDPAVQSLTSFVGVDGTNPSLNSARLQINLKPLDERDDRVQKVIARLQTAVDKVPGVDLFLRQFLPLFILWHLLSSLPDLLLRASQPCAARWLWISYRMMPAATETLKLSTPVPRAAISRLTTPSQSFFTSCDTPLPSLPSTSAMGPVRLFRRRDTPSISAQ